MRIGQVGKYQGGQQKDPEKLNDQQTPDYAGHFRPGIILRVHGRHLHEAQMIEHGPPCDIPTSESNKHDPSGKSAEYDQLYPGGFIS